MYLDFIKKNESRINGPLLGCTDNEIQELEKKLNIELPEAYREFLLIAGKEFGTVFSGSDYRIDLIPELQKDGKEILYRRTKNTLSDKSLIFLIHQDYLFYFFDLNKAPDPVVYEFMEPDEPAEIKPQSYTFSDFIFSSLDNHVKLSNYLKNISAHPPRKGDIPIIER